MNKSVLVLDTPNSCSQCGFCGRVEDVETYDSEAYCTVTLDPDDNDLCRMILTKDKYKKEKPDWCPLKKIPEMSNAQQGIYEWDEYCNGYDNGWNGFRDEILGETTNEELKSTTFEDKNLIDVINDKLEKYYKQQKENKWFSEKGKALICRVIENCQKIVNDTYEEGE